MYDDTLAADEAAAVLERQANLLHERWQDTVGKDDALPLSAGFFAGSPTVFYHPVLERRNPDAIIQLFTIADEFGFAVCRDRRIEQQAIENERRRRFALAVGLSASLLVNQPSVAGDSQAGSELTVYAAADAGTLRLTRRQLTAEQLAVSMQRLGLCTADSGQPCIAADLPAASRIERILLDKLPPAHRDDQALRTRLHVVAYYYSQFPAVSELLQEVAALPVTLLPKPGVWQTRATLSGDRVKGVNVEFDLGVGAQMHFVNDCDGRPACSVTPADALVHELLHVQLIFADPAAFISAARAHGYPHDHEFDVIARERDIYQSMEAIDGLPRPQRNRHVARLVAVDCPVCWAR